MLGIMLHAGLVGGVTGIISHLLRNNRVLIFPKKREKPKGIYLGFIADFLFGAAAAIFAVTYLVPDAEQLQQIVGVSILAGLSAENLLIQKELNTEKAKVEGLNRINQRLQ